MRKLLSLLTLATLALNLHAEPKWLTDLDAAKQQAQKENKAVLLDFTGSDWCPPCKALKKSVFDGTEFAQYAEKNLVLVEVDFPNDKSKVSKQVAASNDKLSKQFKISSYPTIVILDKTGKEVGRFDKGYGGEPAAAYIKKLDALVAKAK